MKWFILVIMMGTFSNGEKDIFVYHNPELPSLEACQQYVYVQSGEIRRQMMIEFQGRQIERVFCIQEDKLKKFLEVSAKPPGSSI